MSNSTLKMIALVTMMIDHIGFCLFPDQDIYRFIGRTAFPIYVFLLVEGFYRTRDVKKYLLRLVLFAAISEIPFDLAFWGRVVRADRQNVFFTLALGLFMLWCLDTFEKSGSSIKTVLQLFVFFSTMFAAWALHTDYSYCGIAVIFLFYRFRSDDILIELTKYVLVLTVFFMSYGWKEMPCVMALPLIHFYNGKRGMKLKYAFYAFYPIHLMCLWGVETYLMDYL